MARTSDRERSRDKPRLPPGRIVVPAGLAAFFFLAATAGTISLYRWHELLLLLLIYGSLALCVDSVSQLMRKVPGPTDILAALFLGCVVVYHLRHQTDRIWFSQNRAFSIGLLIVASCLLYVVLDRGARQRRTSVLLNTAVAGAVLFSAFLLVGSQASGSMRWHLLKHNRMIGTLLYHSRIARLIDIDDSLRGIPIGSIPRGDHHDDGDAGPEPRHAARPPDVVFLLIDTLRADALAPFGGDPQQMPRLSQLAESAFVFDDVWATASWTRPSIASFFTGLLPEQVGVLLSEDVLVPEAETLAERLALRGYDTAGFVTNYHVGSEVGFAQGFGHFEEFPDASVYARAEEVSEETLAWVDRRAPSVAPLFLYVHLLDPHTPYKSGGKRFFDPKHSRNAYRHELAYADRHVVQLIEGLRTRLGPDAVILLTSDHGEEFGEHGMFGHGHTLYRELLWIPTLLWNGAEPGVAIDARLDGRDIFHLLEAVSRAEPLDIESWARGSARRTRYASSFSRVGRKWSDRLLFPYRYQRLRGIETDGSFLVWSGYGPTYELYDMAGDELQQENIADAHPEEVKQLGEALDEIVEFQAPRQGIEQEELDLERLRGLGYAQ